MKKMLFIVNPHAGKGYIKNSLLRIVDLYTEAGYLVTVYTTQCEKDATDCARSYAADYDVVVCSGGDGTLDEVVTGVLACGKKVPIGYIPAGSTNDFAKSMSIPSSKMKAASLVLEGAPFYCDVGTFNFKPFIYVAAFGAFTEVSYSTPQNIKNSMGHMAYILEGAKSLANIKSFHIRMECGGQKMEDDFIFGMITNSLSVGGMKSYQKSEVDFDDGLFEIMMIRKPRNPIELQNIIAGLLLSDPGNEMFYCFKTSKVLFVSPTPIPWTLDGEYGGDVKEAYVENVEKAFAIYRKSKYQNEPG